MCHDVLECTAYLVSYYFVDIYIYIYYVYLYISCIYFLYIFLVNDCYDFPLQVIPTSVHPGTPTMDPNMVAQLGAQMSQLQLSGASVGDEQQSTF